MKINKTIYTFILIAGILLILNTIRLLWALITGSEIFNTNSDIPFIMLFNGGPFGIFLAVLGGKGFKDQEILPRFLKRWKYKFILILIGVIVLTLINLN